MQAPPGPSAQDHRQRWRRWLDADVRRNHADRFFNGLAMLALPALSEFPLPAYAVNRSQRALPCSGHLCRAVVTMRTRAQ